MSEVSAELYTACVSRITAAARRRKATHRLVRLLIERQTEQDVVLHGGVANPAVLRVRAATRTAC
jgi:hypothetical protein